MIEMTCPWMENRQMKKEEKMVHSDGNSSCNIQEVSQRNIIKNVLGGHSKDAGKSIKCLIGVRS